LNAAIEAVDDSSPYWRKGKDHFSRSLRHDEDSGVPCSLPKNATPPYQTIYQFPIRLLAVRADQRESRHRDF
jgi:hypothetical protein